MVIKKRNVDKSRHITTFVITTLIFIIGIIVGNYFSNSKLSKIQSIEDDIKKNTLAIETQTLMVAENPCVITNSTLTEEIYGLSEKLGYMESELGLNNPKVIELKEYYLLLEIRHWLLMKKAMKECNLNTTLILFFYSNKGDCSTCKEQGYVLTYIRKKYPNVWVYPFDINIHDPALDTLQSMFLNKKQTPALVINGVTYYGFMDRNKIEGVLFNQTK